VKAYQGTPGARNGRKQKIWLNPCPSAVYVEINQVVEWWTVVFLQRHHGELRDLLLKKFNRRFGMAADKPESPAKRDRGVSDRIEAAPQKTNVVKLAGQQRSDSFFWGYQILDGRRLLRTIGSQTKCVNR
jgi:hypothetical protein